MTFNRLSDLLTEAEQALRKGDQRTAGALINQVLEQDFTNVNAWRLLHLMMDADQPFETFQRVFAQKYYPDRVHLLKPRTERSPYEATVSGVSLSNSSKSATSKEPVTRRPTKKCPYCAEEILSEAKVCRFCGRDLTKEPPEVLAEKRVQLTRKLSELEKSLARWKRYLQEQSQLAQQAGRQVTWALVGLIVGIFLIPAFGIGLILVIAGILAAITQGVKRGKAERNQSKARKSIETISGQIVEVKTALAALHQ
jgi:hypothetical protein